MKFKSIALAATALAFILPATAHAGAGPTYGIQSLTAPFTATNSTVTKTPDGVHFGTYADGGALGGSLIYTGFNGHKLSELTDFTYAFSYRQAGESTGAAPYARVFLDTDDDGVTDADVILDPSYCATTTPEQSKDLTYQLVGGSVRYNDDGCDGVAPDNQPYADVVAAHGNEKILGLIVSQGNSTGHDVSAILRYISVNGTYYVFNVPPAAGDTGAAGSTGATGAQGEPGTTTIITRVLMVGGGVTEPTKPIVCTGATERTVHVTTRKGQRLVSAKATLRGKTLDVDGREVTVDLSGRSEGNYNVQITARYRDGAKTRTVRSTRTLSVACS